MNDTLRKLLDREIGRYQTELYEAEKRVERIQEQLVQAHQKTATINARIVELQEVLS